jgi:hypothetical protein
MPLSSQGLGRPYAEALQRGNRDIVPVLFGQSADFVQAVVLRPMSCEDACGAAFAGGPVALAYARFAACTRQAAHAEYVAAIAPYRRGNGYAIPGEFVIACGDKR